MGRKTKTARQVRYLLSKGSPLTSGQRSKLRSELHSHAVRIVKAKPARRRK